MLKLIIQSYILIYPLLLLFPFSETAGQQYSVQVAASKTNLNIPAFAKKHNITEPIVEVISEDWCRYFVGTFPEKRSADRFAAYLALEKGISGAFPRKMETAQDNSATVQKKDSAYQVSKLSEISEINQGDSINIEKPLASALKEPVLKAGNRLLLLARKPYALVGNLIKDHRIILVFIVLIVLFIINILVILLTLFVTNQRKNHKERYIMVFGIMYEEILRMYLFGEISWEVAKARLKGNNKRLNRKILTSVLLNFQKNLRGSVDNQILEIFIELGLFKDAMKSAKSVFYFNKVIGISELTELYPQGANEIIQQNINNPNDLVRAEAQRSYIRLHPEMPFDFLKDLRSPFTVWMQLTAFYLFRLHQITIPSFVDYLDSGNSNVRNFSLRMIIFFQQFENASEIIKLAESPLESTRFLSIRAINDLRLYDGKEQIKSRYPEETEKNRLEIIKALKNLGNSEDFDFLETIICRDSISAKTEACRSLYFMNAEGQERLINLGQNTDLEIERYIAHITDPRN